MLSETKKLVQELRFECTNEFRPDTADHRTEQILVILDALIGDIERYQRGEEHRREEEAYHQQYVEEAS